MGGHFYQGGGGGGGGGAFSPRHKCPPGHFFLGTMHCQGGQWNLGKIVRGTAMPRKKMSGGTVKGGGTEVPTTTGLQQ